MPVVKEDVKSIYLHLLHVGSHFSTLQQLKNASHANQVANLARIPILVRNVPWKDLKYGMETA